MDDKNIKLLNDYLKSLLYGPEIGHLNVEELSEPYQELGYGLQKLQKTIEQLREESGNAVHRADMMESYHGLLIEMLSRRNEWLLVVDKESKEVLYCNKKNQGEIENPSYCSQCKIRLSFQPQILSWNGKEQYEVWEMEDENGMHYRITSFPIEWQEHSSSAHIIVDITDEKQAARNLASKAYHDPGTGIKNRLFFKEYMETVLNEKREATLCYLDLDGLKYVNDTFGHQEGDTYIQNFVEIIRKNFRSGDTFARIGGDEFCLVLTGDIKHLIERKMEEILKQFQEGGFSDYQCSFSYGIVEISGEKNEMSFDEILQKADALMYECKRRNKEKYPTLVR